MAWSEKRNSGGISAPQSHTLTTAKKALFRRIDVSVVTHSRLATEAVVWNLGRLPDINAVAAAATNPESAADTHANVVLLDAAVLDSLSIAEKLGQAHREAKLIVTNLSPRDEHIAEFVTRGAAGFVLKDASLDELACTIRAVADGMAVLPTDLMDSLFSRVRDAAGRSIAEGADVRPRLTPREQAVIDLVSAGLATRVIGTRLNISGHTVKSHVRNILAKLELHSCLELAAWAHRSRA